MYKERNLFKMKNEDYSCHSFTLERLYDRNLFEQIKVCYNWSIKYHLRACDFSELFVSWESSVKLFRLDDMLTKGLKKIEDSYYEKTIRFEGVELYHNEDYETVVVRRLSNL